MKNIIALIICIVAASCSCSKKANDSTATEPDKSIKTSVLIERLSSDEFAGRKPGTEGMQKATAYVKNYMQDLKIEPMFNGSYLDTVDVRGVEGYNLVGVINGKNNPEDYILIGAHLDHIGTKASETDSIFNGANDNASGVTAVMQIAKELVKDELNKNVIIALFTGEESGLVGARHLSARLKNDKIPLSYVVNFEMIGVPLVSDSSQIYMTGYEKSNFAATANQLLEEEFITDGIVVAGRDLFRMSDNYPFYRDFNIPSHTFCTFDFKNYKYFHHVDDEFEELNVEHMEYIIDKMTSLVLKLLKSDVEVELVSEEVSE